MSPHKQLTGEESKGGRNWMMGSEAFERRMPHHDGIRTLWETKWKFPVSLSGHPLRELKGRNIFLDRISELT